MRQFIRFISVFIICLNFCVCFAKSIYQTQLDNAEESFKKGDFVKTIEIYESLIQVEKVRDPYVYYNLANAYYRSGVIGKAILNIEKALKLAPRDKDIKNNAKLFYEAMGHARHNRIQDIILKHFSLNEVTAVVSVILVLFLLVLALFLLKENSSLKKAILLFVFFLIICLPVFILKSCDEFSVKKAVALYPSIVRNGPGENNSEIFRIPEGKVVDIVSENGEWLNISVESDGKTNSGWIRLDAIGSIDE